MDSENKDKFNWDKGQVLDEKNAKPLGGVRLKGFQKISDGLLADPEKRVEERREHLSGQQSQKYEEQVKQKKSQQKRDENSLVVEESESGIGQYEEQDAKSLMDKLGSADKTETFRRAGRFDNKKPSDDN